MRQAILIGVGVFWSMIPPALAQPSFTVSLSHGLDGLQPVGDAMERQQNVSASGAVAQALLDQRLRLSYRFDTGTYATPGDWQFLQHDAGGSYRLDFGSSRHHRLYSGGGLTFRSNGASWEAEGYRGIHGFANLELHPLAQATVRTGYRLDLRRFPDNAGLDHAQQTAFGSVLVNLPSRTTLIGELAAGTKRYDGIAAGASAARAHQVTVFARMAQSLADRTGASVEVSRRQVMGQVAPAAIATPAHFFDDGVYDDPFASDLDVARGTIKTIVRNGVQIVASSAWHVKRYGATSALDAGGTPVPGVWRRDDLMVSAASVSWPIAPDRTGAYGVDLLVSYGFTRHRSTTAVYNYTAHRVGVGVTVGY